MVAGGDFREWVKQAGAEAGFDLAGVAAVQDAPELAYFPGWIVAGRGGEMKYLEARDEGGRLQRASLAQVAPWARSVVVCALNYNTAAPRSIDSPDPRRGWISRYAWGSADYHDVVMKKLRRVEARLRASYAEVQTRCYVDTGPVLERVYAKYAGVGWIGKNTCVIHSRLGSWLFLGVILTSLETAPQLPAPDRCGSCTACIDACPTQAIVVPYELDAARCISYLTIEKRGEIPEALRADMGRHVFGCDICQDVCPWNRRAPASTAWEFQPRSELVNPELGWLAGLSEEEFRGVFRGSAVRRTRRSGLRRNAALAMGNSRDQTYISLLQELVGDADTVVARHAAWALRRLRAPAREVERAMSSPSANSPTPGEPGDRRHLRYRSDIRLEVRGVRNHEEFTVLGRCSALSEGGVGGILSGELQPGEVVTLDFILPTLEQPLSISSVVRFRAGFYHGIEFLVLSEAEREAIVNYCKSLKPVR